MKISQKDYEKFIDKYPNLTTHGFGVCSGPFDIADEHNNLKKLRREFLLCIEMWNNKFSINDEDGYEMCTNYLKHRAEHYSWNVKGKNLYVPQGACVAALLYLGLPYTKSTRTTAIIVNAKES